MPAEHQAQSLAFQTASALRKWGISKNLILPLPAAVENSTVANVAPANLSDAAESLLRSKGINTISYNDTDQYVSVYTRKKIYAKDLKILPQEIAGCEIWYPQGGIEELGKPPQVAQGASYSVIQSAGAGRYACGSSISPGNSASAGTMGALVKDGAGNVYGLTNNHVSGACSHSPIGLPILAPGVLDVCPGGVNPFTLGMHSTVLEMNVGTQGNVNIFANLDAAIFQIIEPLQVSSSQGGRYDTPITVTDPSLGLDVEKVGRTTGYTAGTIVGKELAPIGVYCTAHEYGFSGTVWFSDVYTVHGLEDVFSQGGDSGSLIVSRDEGGNRSAVGLLFAGGQDSLAPGGDRTLMLPLRPILERLNVSLVSGHNV